MVIITSIKATNAKLGTVLACTFMSMRKGTGSAGFVEQGFRTFKPDTTGEGLPDPAGHQL